MKSMRLFISCLFISFLWAQNLDVPTLSPFTEIKQQVALTEVKLEYSRPSMKGRTVFGELVPFGQIWRTGANASTKVTFTQAVEIAGNKLEAGTYALYTIPGPTEWTIIIHGNTKLRALAGDVYKETDDLFRFKTKVKQIPLEIETFTIEFTDLTTHTANLTLSWEHTLVSFKIDFQVDRIVDQQIEKLTGASQMNDRNLFLAAEYYYHNDKDLDKALSWINEALQKKEKDPRYGLLKAKILSKLDKSDQALETIQAANQWAKDTENYNYINQTQLFWDSID